MLLEIIRDTGSISEMEVESLRVSLECVYQHFLNDYLQIAEVWGFKSPKVILSRALKEQEQNNFPLSLMLFDDNACLQLVQF